MKHIIYLALGANIGDKKQYITQAVELLGDKVTDILLAPIYETKPWGYAEQGDFLNTALRGETELSPHELLLFVKDVEAKVGRVKRFRNGPREIDIDILFYDNVIHNESTLEIPHPRIQDRDFVLRPLMDIAPDFMHPVAQMTIQQLFIKLSQ